MARREGKMEHCYLILSEIAPDLPETFSLMTELAKIDMMKLISGLIDRASIEESSTHQETYGQS